MNQPGASGSGAPSARAPSAQPTQKTTQPVDREPAHSPPSPHSAAQASAQASQARSFESAEQAAAADVLRHYYSAIDARDYQTAYALWSDHGKASRQTFETFRARFAATRATWVDVTRPGHIEGAAGSLYITIPVTVHAELNDGNAQTFIGSYALRRINDVEGSSLDDRRWHIHTASLHTVP